MPSAIAAAHETTTHEAGCAYRDEVVAAAVLHDVVEDTGAEPAELEDRFGTEVAGLLAAVTEPSVEGGYRERKARLRATVAAASDDALMIVAADKVAKTRELRMTLACAPWRSRIRTRPSTTGPASSCSSAGSATTRWSSSCASSSRHSSCCRRIR